VDHDFIPSGMKKKILFVSVAFPPKSDPEALQTAKYFHYLQKHRDLQIDVVTSAVPTLYMPYDKDLEPYAEGIHKLISIPLKENRYLNFLRDRMHLQHTVFPDVKQSFHKQYGKVIRQLKEKPDLIYSRSDPKSSTIMAYKLQKKLKIPWILHLSDPWADCPLRKLKGRYYEKNNAWENRCVEAADIISLTSIPTIEFYRKKYPGMGHKFRFFPNVYEIAVEKSQATAIEKNRKFRIVYTGGLAAARSPEFLLKPLKELYKQDADLANQLEVIFAGEADAKNRAIFHQYELPFVKWLGKLPFHEALRLQRSADYLVVIDNPIEDPAMSMFFPSKLLDYMVARKRIIAITTRGSASDRVMQDLKGDVCSHDEGEKIKASVLKALTAFHAGDNNYLFNDQPPVKYEAAHNAERLYSEMLNLIDV
jgi:glycosyltransferase involved in cell wall biosynthesis